MHIRHLACLAAAIIALLSQSNLVSRAEDANVARRAEAGRQLALADPRVRDLDERRRDGLVSFVIGNIFFTLTHELGHALISEFKLPVLGREEDAADSFATLAMLNIGNDVTHQILLNTARGLFFMAEREKKGGRPEAMYNEHGLDPQRAFAIICLMVGSDRRAFRQAATLAKMPEDRQESCAFDYERASDSWASLLKSHARKSTEPSFLDRLLHRRTATPEPRRVLVKSEYAKAQGAVEPYRAALIAAGVLERVADTADKAFAFPKAISVKGEACGEPNAFWDERSRQLTLCYELVAEYVKLGLETPEP